MSKTIPPGKPDAARPKAPDAEAVPHKPSGVRETIESVVIAFVLAFLFRTFEAEAFVIPTGSMASTLMGMHKDLACEQCGFPYRVGVPEQHPHLNSCACPNCGYTMRFGEKPPELREPPSYKGDRIIVTKSIYDFEDPRRWDVSVFKYPMAAQTNYIKRIVGLPNETLRILGGDIFTQLNPAGDDDTFVIQRKPPVKVKTMLQTVYDNDYQSSFLNQAGWPQRWASEDGGWQPLDDHKQYEVDGAVAESWLRYRHLLPTHNWSDMQAGIAPQARADYICDGYAYNAGNNPSDPQNLALRGTKWVGDLAVECDLTVDSVAGEAIFELIDGQRRFQCRLDLATGEASLSAEGIEDFAPTAATKITRLGTYHIRFANVDDELLLWIDESLVEFDRPTTYELEQRPRKGPLDLARFGIGARGATLKVDHLRVWRDIYYLADRFNPRTEGPIDDHEQGEDFALGEGQFMALGDNSPRSKDSRLWNGQDAQGNPEHYVDRKFLIGKAMFIYWPHALDRIPGTDVWFPMVPNVRRMEFVH